MFISLILNAIKILTKNLQFAQYVQTAGIKITVRDVDIPTLLPIEESPCESTGTHTIIRQIAAKVQVSRRFSFPLSFVLYSAINHDLAGGGYHRGDSQQDSQPLGR